MKTKSIAAVFIVSAQLAGDAQNSPTNQAPTPEVSQPMSAASAAADENRLIAQARGQLWSKKTNDCVSTLEQILSKKGVRPITLSYIVELYSQMDNAVGRKAAMSRLAESATTLPEAGYYLALAQVKMGKNDEAKKTLQSALALNSKRLAANPRALDIKKLIGNDQRLTKLIDRP